MNCVHDPFNDGTTLRAIAQIRGTHLHCRVCGSFRNIDMAGIFGEGAIYPPPEQPEDSPQLRIAEFEQASAAPTWVCDMGQVHPVGEACTLEHP